MTAVRTAVHFAMDQFESIYQDYGWVDEDEYDDRVVIKTLREKDLLEELLSNELLREKLESVRMKQSSHHHFMDVISNAKRICEDGGYGDYLDDFYNVCIWFLENLNLQNVSDASYYIDAMEERIILRASECLTNCLHDNSKLYHSIHKLYAPTGCKTNSQK